MNIDPEALCRRCGDRLRGLDVARCPECGRDFDCLDSRTYRMPRNWWNSAVAAAGAALAPVRSYEGQRICLAVVACALMLVWQVRTFGGLLIALPVGLFLACSVIVMLALSRRKNARWKCGRGAAAAALIFGLVANIGYDRCPHARYLSIGPVLVTVSGKACRNQRRPMTLLAPVLGESYWAYRD